MAGTEMDMVGVSNLTKVFQPHNLFTHLAFLLSFRTFCHKSSTKEPPRTREKWLEW